MMRSGKIRIRTLLMFAVALSLGSFVTADITNITTSTSGYASIQAAIDDASPNDVIEVGDGNYAENLTINKDITLRSQNGAAVTTITGSNAVASPYTLTFGGAETSACVVQGFTLSGSGGAGAITGAATHATVQNCILNGDASNYAGYLVYDFDGLFQENTVTNTYVIYNSFYACDGSILRNVIVGNHAPYNWLFYYMTATVENNLIAENNTAGGIGYAWGGIARNNTIANNTFWTSWSLDNGNAFGVPSTFVNNICWGNTNNTLAAVAGGARVATYCDGYSSGTGNINIDPNFVGSGDYSLNDVSPCIDAGDIANNPGVDITGSARDALPDMGAYEFYIPYGTATITESDGSTAVSEEGPTSDTYTVVLDSEPNVADVTIVVTPDTQTEVNGQGAGNPINLVFTAGDWNVPQTVTVTAIDDAVLEHNHTSTITHITSSTDPLWDGIPVGNVLVQISDNECGAWGFDPMDFNTDCRVDLGDFVLIAGSWVNCSTPYQAGCINYLELPVHVYAGQSIQAAIDAASNGQRIIVHDGTYAEHVILNKLLYIESENGPASTIVDGTNSGVTFRCLVEANGSSVKGLTLANGVGSQYSGANIVGNNADVDFDNCVITGSTGPAHAAVYINGDITNCHFYNNTCDGVVVACNGRVANCLIENNTGNFMVVVCTGTVENNLIVNNTSNTFATMYYNSGTIRNNTIAGNTSVYTFAGSSGASYVNNIDWNNSTGGLNTSTTDTVTYSASNVSIPGTGNILLSADPMVNAAGGDYHLAAGSPCIDAGNPANAPVDDYAGTARDATPDIGAYEY